MTFKIGVKACIFGGVLGFMLGYLGFFTDNPKFWVALIVIVITRSLTQD